MNGAFLRDKQDSEPARRLVLLSGRDVEDAARLMRMLAESAEAELVGTSGGGRPQVLTRDDLVEAARTELARRSRRKRLFPDSIFGEPAWEMLLLLYSEQQGTRFNIAQLSSKLKLPGTTTLRWLNYLEDQEMVDRDPNPVDQRTAFLRLTAKAIEALDLYFSETLARSP